MNVSLSSSGFVMNASTLYKDHTITVTQIGHSMIHDLQYKIEKHGIVVLSGDVVSTGESALNRLYDLELTVDDMILNPSTWS